jgi:predicted TIM-barrel fold metal-dependent hydrolase
MVPTYLVTADRTPPRAAWPVIDAHNHLWGNWDVRRLLDIMDAVGVAGYCDLTANAKLHLAGGGYILEPGDLDAFMRQCAAKCDGRLYGFTMATFAHPIDRPLFRDGSEFAQRTAELLRSHVGQGARGLKLTKELGLHFRDSAGELVRVDDERLGVIWDQAAKLGVPVLMHQSDPVGFFEPVTPDNEHYESLQKYPSWSFADAKFPRKSELLARRNRVLARHPGTVFILPHVANYPENLQAVAALLDSHPNAYIDFSARIDELGRQPYTAREFFIRYQDRILFGTDMPASVEMYRCYFRFLETFDEGFFPPDYDGTFGRHRWAICGIGLPKSILAKIYYKNALRVIPGLRKDLARHLHRVTNP